VVVSSLLLDREAELAAAEAALGEVSASGTGQIVVVSGLPGIGKTRLLDEIIARAEGRGVRVLRATGGELEQDLPFSVARQLLGDAPRIETAAGMTGPDSGDAELRELDALYDAYVTLAAREPLLMIVDDAHWADAPSVKFLLYVGRRLADLPVMVVLAVRQAGMGGRRPELALLLERVDQTLELPALSEGSTADLVHTMLGELPDGDFTRACLETTGGNPLLLRELLLEVAGEGLTPQDAASAQLRQMGSISVARSALLRVSSHGPSAVSVTAAVAVLGRHATLPLVAAIAEVPPADAELVVDALVDAHLLCAGQPLRFVHPLVQSSIYRHMPAGLRSRRHREAARLLALAGARDEEVARHLMGSDPAGDMWVREQLLRSGLHALWSGAPDAARRMLRRALDEDPTRTDSTLLLHLGEAEAIVRDPAALEHLQQAFSRAADGVTQTRVSLPLARTLARRGRFAEAAHVLDTALAATDTDQREPELRLRCERLWLNESGPLPTADYIAAAESLATGLTGATHGERLALTHLSTARFFTGTPQTKVRELINLALGDGALLADEGPESRSWLHASTLLGVTGDYVGAEQEIVRGEQTAYDLGALDALVQIRAVRAWLVAELGELGAAERLARDVLERVRSSQSRSHRYASACLTTVLTEMGRYDEASTVITQAAQRSSGLDRIDALVLHAQAELGMAMGSADGVDDLLAVGHWCSEHGIEHPAEWSWRTDVAPALADRGDVDSARRLIAEELERARSFGAARPLGRALHAAALVGRPEDRAAGLHSAVDVLAASPAKLATAKVYLHLGAHLRSAGVANQAREPLRLALALATECGAEPVVQDAHRLLLSVGARPRRVALSGPASLTPMEREAAAQAAQGHTNREVATRLYVSVKTVEKHLRNTYLKLGIERRNELAAALEEARDETQAG